jgi:hypothetical protein
MMMVVVEEKMMMNEIVGKAFDILNISHLV